MSLPLIIPVKHRPKQFMRTVDSARRIAVVGPHAPYRGGIAHFTNRLCQELESGGHDVLRVSFSRLYPAFLYPGRNQFEPGTQENRRREPDEPAVSIQIDSINPISWWVAAHAMKEEHVDAVLFMYWMPFFSPAYTVIATVLRRAGIRVLTIVHNAIPHERHAGDRFLSAVFLKRCDSIAVMSDAVGKDVESLVPGTGYETIPHPVYDHFGELLPKDDARRLLDLPVDEPVLLFFGFVRHYKGLAVLIDAIARARSSMEGLTLIVAGEFYDNRTQYTDQIRNLELEGNVTLYDEYIASERVSTFFSAADVIVQPYISATQSGIVQTSFYFERPVIVTNVGGLAEAVETPGAGLVVPPGDSIALADAICRFFVPDVRKRLENGARFAKEASSWDGFATFVLKEIERN